MDPWVKEHAAHVVARFERDLAALVGVSSPSGDVDGFEECASVAAALAPEEATVERPPCSSPDHAPDLLLRLRGDRDGRRVLLLVADEEWRTTPFVHVEAFAGWDACLCFEAGQLADGEEALIVRRKGAGTVRVLAHGRAAHSGSAPDRGRNALLALGAAARAVAGCHAPSGPDRVTAVPTVMNSGDAFNVVPAAGELLCDVRADRLEAIEAVAEAVPPEVDGVRLEVELVRRWPPMDSREATVELLERAGAATGRPIVPSGRGGASDASHFAPAIPVTVDGLGPRGGAAHNPGEHLLVESVQPRAEIALATTLAALRG